MAGGQKVVWKVYPNLFPMESVMGETTEGSKEETPSCEPSYGTEEENMLLLAVVLEDKENLGGGIRMNGDLNGSCEEDMDVCEQLSPHNLPSSKLPLHSEDSVEDISDNSVHSNIEEEETADMSLEENGEISGSAESDAEEVPRNETMDVASPRESETEVPVSEDDLENMETDDQDSRTDIEVRPPSICDRTGELTGRNSKLGDRGSVCSDNELYNVLVGSDNGSPDKDNDLVDVDNELEDSDNESKDRHDELDQEDNEQGDKDIELDQKVNELEDRDDELDQKDNELEDRDDELDQKDNELEDRDDELDQKDNYLDDRGNEEDDTITKLDDIINKLDDEENNAENEAEAVKEIQNTDSDKEEETSSEALKYQVDNSKTKESSNSENDADISHSEVDIEDSLVKNVSPKINDDHKGINKDSTGDIKVQSTVIDENNDKGDDLNADTSTKDNADVEKEESGSESKQDNADDLNKSDSKAEESSETPGKIKKSRKSSTVLNVTPRRSSRNINKVPKHIERDEDPDIEEITPEDPLAVTPSSDPFRDAGNKENSKARNSRNKTIVVKDTKRLVEIAAGSKPLKGKKEPTLVIIDTNSILSGRGPVPVSISHAQKSVSLVAGSSATSSPSTSGYSMLPMALPAQGMYPPNMSPITQSSMRVPIPTAPAPKPRPQILPSLSDDMFVVEAPSFIVPYVYEKPPINPLRKYVDSIAEILKERKEKQEKELKEKEAKEKAEAEQAIKDKEVTKVALDSEESETIKDEIKKDEAEESSKEDKAIELSKDKAGELLKDDKTNETSKDDKAGSERSDEQDKKESVKIDKNSDVSEPVSKTAEKDKPKETPDTEPSKPSYFENPLGKFFMSIGVNLVQEYVQTDLLRTQKKKRDREGGKGGAATQYAINSLIKNLAFSKENNEPFHLEVKKCEYCSFKTESALVMAQHLETPHMRNYVYRCNFCPLEVRSPHDILFHMEAEHNVRGRLERAPAFHQCFNCPFEDNQKGKLTRHLISCGKKFKLEKNQEPPSDWEPPAKIPRLARNRPANMGIGEAAYRAMTGKQNPGVPHPLLPKMVTSPPVPGAGRGRGRPPIHSRYGMELGKMPVQRPIVPTQIRHGMLYRPNASGSQMLLPTTYQISGNQIYQGQMMPMMPGGLAPVPRLTLMPPAAPGSSQSAPTPVALVPNIAAGSNSITIQNTNKNNPAAKLLQQPSISITPLPRQSANTLPANSAVTKPGTSPGGKATFVICEICDGYIKDLEQLRNHMQWIHKVKIHPKMIYNRPPLNCQKCQFRFFTDQGLERHLLGSHGLVTSSMQEAANKGKDGGRCPVCGRPVASRAIMTMTQNEFATGNRETLYFASKVEVYQWKLLNHVARDHNMTLKPAHLSYKCTVCTATFGMYKQFECHVYSAHSVVAKRVMDKKTPQQGQGAKSQSSSDSLLKPLKINDEITIIPQPARPRPGPASRTGAMSAAAQAASGAKVWECQKCDATYDGTTGFTQYLTHIKRRHAKRCTVKLCRLDACPTCRRRHVTQTMLDYIDDQKNSVDVIELSDDEVVIGQGRNEITITKVSCAPGPKRFKQRLAQASANASSNVQVIEIEDALTKNSKENGEDSLSAVKERLRRRKSLEISQIDSDGNPQQRNDD
uniref:MOG interacting and ectopic P-granules protein 1 n=1 Tax=Timema poppense TaxID=170557 RepID=A0A7R9GRN5_TIMPO|nr:unnamed protein product [Timema poppensis]